MLRINNPRAFRARARVVSVWTWECFDADGNLKWVDERHNLVTDEGLDALLDIMFAAGTQITSWYCALFEDNHTPAAGDTYAVPGYTECTAYDESTRPAWTPGSVSSQSVNNNASKASFTMNASKTIYGAALVGGGTAADTKGDTAGGGTLYCLSLLSAARAVISTDVIKLTITLTSADDGV